jgi:hypothetical protein
LLFEKFVNSPSKLPLSELNVSNRYLFSIAHRRVAVYPKLNSASNEVNGQGWLILASGF